MPFHLCLVLLTMALLLTSCKTQPSKSPVTKQTSKQSAKAGTSKKDIPVKKVLFQGPLLATMPKQETLNSPAEDARQAKLAGRRVRVVFSENSHPVFAEVIQKELIAKWNKNLDFELVFGEAEGPLEKQATAHTIQLHLNLYRDPYFKSTGKNAEDGIDKADLFWGVEMSGHCFPTESTSWGLLQVSAVRKPPYTIQLGKKTVEQYNRENLGTIYQEFRAKAKKIPPFVFFPQKEYTNLRKLYGHKYSSTADYPMSPDAFVEEILRLKQTKIQRRSLTDIARYLIEQNHAEFAEGVAMIINDLSPHSDDKDFIVSSLAYADYAILKATVIEWGYIYFKEPQFWADLKAVEIAVAEVIRGAEQKNPRISGTVSHLVSNTPESEIERLIPLLKLPGDSGSAADTIFEKLQSRNPARARELAHELLDSDKLRNTPLYWRIQHSIRDNKLSRDDEDDVRLLLKYLKSSSDASSRHGILQLLPAKVHCQSDASAAESNPSTSGTTSQLLIDNFDLLLGSNPSVFTFSDSIALISKCDPAAAASIVHSRFDAWPDNTKMHVVQSFYSNHPQDVPATVIDFLTQRSQSATPLANGLARQLLSTLARKNDRARAAVSQLLSSADLTPEQQKSFENALNPAVATPRPAPAATSRPAQATTPRPTPKTQSANTEPMILTVEPENAVPERRVKTRPAPKSTASPRRRP